MTYNPSTGMCDGECAAGTITIIGDDGHKECVSCDPYEGYEPYINQYSPGKFACYYYSSRLKLPNIGVLADSSGSGSYWHGTGDLWKSYSSFMGVLRGLERPKDLVEGSDIVENLSGSEWTQAKYDQKGQYITGTGGLI